MPFTTESLIFVLGPFIPYILFSTSLVHLHPPIIPHYCIPLPFLSLFSIVFLHSATDFVLSFLRTSPPAPRFLPIFSLIPPHSIPFPLIPSVFLDLTFLDAYTPPPIPRLTLYNDNHISLLPHTLTPAAPTFFPPYSTSIHHWIAPFVYLLSSVDKYDVDVESLKTFVSPEAATRAEHKPNIRTLTQMPY